jgi:hypothetical protein
MLDTLDQWWDLLSPADRALMLRFRHRPLTEPVVDRLAASGQLETGDHPYWMPEDLAAFLDAVQESAEACA